MSKICGIYCILNTTDGKRYIGQSIDATFRCRRHFQLLDRGCHFNSHLQGSFNKYGKNVFEFSVLEIAPVAMLDVREGAWIDYYHTSDDQFGYNTEGGGYSGRNPSAETRAKISAANKGRIRTPEMRARYSTAKKAQPMTPARIAQLAAIHETRKGQHFSTEHKQKISASLVGHPCSPATRRKISEAKRKS